MVTSITMRTGELREVTFDFRRFPEIVDGDKLTGFPTVVSSVKQGTGSDLAISSVVVNSDFEVICLVTGGTAECTYAISCLCSTQAGLTLKTAGEIIWEADVDLR